MHSELGKSSSLEIYLENPTDMEVQLKQHNTNTTNFEVFPKDIVLKPFNESAVRIQYTPTQVAMDQDGLITLSSHLIGEFTYQVP